MKFHYEGFTKRGDPRKGTVEAASEEEAAGKLRHEMGIFANKIDEEEFDPKLDHAVSPSEAIPFEPENEKTMEELVRDDSLRLKTQPKPEAPPEPKPEADKTMIIPKEAMDKLAQKASNGTEASEDWQIILSRRLTSVGKIVRQVEAWHAMSKELAKGDDLPPGQPDVGPVTWQIWETYKMKVVSELLVRAMEKLPTG